MSNIRKIEDKKHIGGCCAKTTRGSGVVGCSKLGSYYVGGYGVRGYCLTHAKLVAQR